MAEVEIDAETGTFVSNNTGVPTSEVWAALQTQAPEVAALANWSAGTQGSSRSRAGGLFDRDQFVTPEKISDQIRLSQYAADTDDVVAGVLEATESLAFSKMSFYAGDEEEEDIWNQIARDIDLDARLREMWRELFTCSQVYCAIWWGRKSYKVRGKTEKGVARRREFKDLLVPTALSMLDPLKIVPVGTPMFNRDRLAWIADRDEAKVYDEVLTNPTSDPILARMLLGPYEVSKGEQNRLSSEGFEVGRGAKLYELNPEVVFRHTATRPQYQHFANVRMKSVLPLLDLKYNLREKDRAHLIGATNFIVLITKGSDTLPAKPEEIANLQFQVKTVARVPVLVGDHRLSVEIITPKLDNTLKSEPHDVLDMRIRNRLFQMFVQKGGNDKSESLMKVIARGMESRRHMLKRSLERHVFRPVVERNPQLTEDPTLRFHPKQIALDFDSAFASFLLDLRSSNEISRETILSQFDLDQDDEFRMLEREREKYDDVFLTQVPFSAPNPALGPGQPQPQPATAPAQNKSAARRAGGNKNGGGAAPGSGQGQAPRNPRKRSDGRPAAASEGDDDQ